MTARSAPTLSWAGASWLVPPIALAGALVCAGQMLWWFSLGAWPPHDAAAYWVAGLHLRAGEAVYQGDGTFLAFQYAPPFAVIAAVLSFLPLSLVSLLIVAGEVLALRYIAGSWVVAGLLAWLPFVPRELVTGNVNLIMAAVILAGVRGGAGPALALFALMKFSPALVVRRQWRSFLVSGAVLLALTLPWLHLWPEWVAWLATTPDGAGSWLSPWVRVPVAVGLLALRKPWALAAAAGLLVPGFHPHSLVLLLPAARLWYQSRRTASQMTVSATSAS
jgi:hypothetical protein